MRRSSFLKMAKGIAALPLIGLSVPLKAEPKTKLSVRMAHLTDIHVKPSLIAETGMAKALHHVQLLEHQPHFILNGGDAIMDALEADKSNTQIQWQLFKTILAKENALPVYHCIGNHDIWGWFSKSGNFSGDHLYGKQWVTEALALPKRYYHFQKSNWHFIVLDSTQLNPAGGYIAKLDMEQMEWFATVLKTIPSHEFVCIVSHIPILSICAGLFFNKTETNGDLMIKRNLMHTDFLDLKKIMQPYANIRACISGHIHLQDELKYLGVTYYCNGAVSGNWWKGNFQEFAPAYAIMEFYNDGTVSRKFHYYS